MTDQPRKTVLVVDDEPDVATALRMALEDAGFDVVTASNGHEALMKAHQQRPDCVSLDLVMPRESGARFYQHFRKNAAWDDVPVVVVTAHARDEMGEEDFDELFKGKIDPPPNAYLEKPVKLQKYVETVVGLVGSATTDQDGDEADAETLRREIADLLADAPLATLREVRRTLRRE